MIGVPFLIGLTFGGCCSNVYTFEKITKIDKNITTLITFSQYLFIFILLFIFLKYIKYWSKPDLKKIEFDKKFILPLIAQNFSAYLNNLVFQYNVKMPTHIIFRSSGTAITLLFGYLFFNKKYSKCKISGSLLIGIGLVFFTIDINNENGLNQKNTNLNEHESLIGISLLMFSTALSSLTCLFKEKIYQEEQYDWKEVLYYTYFYGVLFYIPFIPQLVKEYTQMNAKEELIHLFLSNWVTQLICIVAVNVLIFKVSALSLTVVLLIRRFVSLISSVIIFNNKLGREGFIGALITFIGAAIYGLGSQLFGGQNESATESKYSLPSVCDNKTATNIEDEAKKTVPTPIVVEKTE